MTEIRSYRPFTRLDKDRVPHKRGRIAYAHTSVWMEYSEYLAFKEHCKERKVSMSKAARGYIKEGMRRWKK